MNPIKFDNGRDHILKEFFALDDNTIKKMIPVGHRNNWDIFLDRILVFSKEIAASKPSKLSFLIKNENKIIKRTQVSAKRMIMILAYLDEKVLQNINDRASEVIRPPTSQAFFLLTDFYKNLNYGGKVQKEVNLGLAKDAAKLFKTSFNLLADIQDRQFFSKWIEHDVKQLKIYNKQFKK